MKTFILLIFFAGNAMASQGPTEFNGSALFKSLKNIILKVRTAKSKSSHKASYGSGFPVDDKGTLITNYHVVSTALSKDEDFKIFVEIDNKNFEAKILAFDAVNDLALLQIDKKFDHYLKIPPPNKIKKGIKIFSIGYPHDLELSIVDGVYNGENLSGGYSIIHISTPLNKGMSGGPTVNSDGEVVGVNVSYLVKSQNVSFAVPHTKIQKLIEKYNSMQEKVDYLKDSKAFEKDLQSQLLALQQIHTDDILNKTETKKYSKWTFQLPKMDNISCWEGDKGDKLEKKFNILANYCRINGTTLMTKFFKSGYYQAYIEVIESEKLNKLQYFTLLQDRFSSTLKPNKRTKTTKDFYTKFDCNKEFIKNKNGVPLKVSFCMRGYVDYEHLYDLLIKGVTLTNSKSNLMIKYRLIGFHKDNLNKVAKHFFDTIEVTDNATN